MAAIYGSCTEAVNALCSLVPVFLSTVQEKSQRTSFHLLVDDMFLVFCRTNACAVRYLLMEGAGYVTLLQEILGADEL